MISPQNPNKLKSRLLEKPLIIFPKGGMGMRIFKYLQSKNVPVSCFADNKEDNALRPSQLPGEYPKANIIIASNIFYDEIKNQVLELGYSEEDIISYEVFFQGHVTWDDIDKVASWDRMRIRVDKIATMLDEPVSSVIDYGAGEMYLRELISKDVKYYPVDYIRRTDETILADLNDISQFPQIKTDVAVLSGLLELLKPAEEFLRHVATHTSRQVIFSYMLIEKFSSIGGRRFSAYVNDWNEEFLINLMAEYGYGLHDKLPDPSHDVNTLFDFRRS